MQFDTLIQYYKNGESLILLEYNKIIHETIYQTSHRIYVLTNSQPSPIQNSKCKIIFRIRKSTQRSESNLLESLKNISEASLKNTNFFSNKQILQSQKYLNKITTNHELSISINFTKCQPIILSELTTMQNQIFPNILGLDVYHLDYHFQTQLNLNKSTQKFYQGNDRIYHPSSKHNIFTQFNRMKKKQINKAQSSTNMKFKYTFRKHNLDLYSQLFAKNQNLIFTLKDSTKKFKGNVIIALAKFNINQIIFQSTSQSNNDLSDQLVKKDIQTFIYFRKLLSFGKIIPIQQMPLFCKIKVSISIVQSILSPQIDQLNELFTIQNQINRALNSSPTKSVNKLVAKLSLQSPKKQILKSPTKQVLKSPTKQVLKSSNRNQSKSPNRIISVSPYADGISKSSLSKSPHHKKSYIKNLLSQKDDNKPQLKIEKITLVQSQATIIQLKQTIKQTNRQQIRYFDQNNIHLIQDLCQKQHVQILLSDNVDFKHTKLNPKIIYKSISENNQNHNLNEYNHKEDNHKDMFTIHLQCYIQLKIKNKQGSLKIKLPYLQKLNKIKNYLKIPFIYLIRILPNNLFSIQNYQNVLEKSQKISQSAKKLQKSQRNQKIQVKNKIIRLCHNIYIKSQDLRSNIFTKNHNFQKLQNNFLHVYYFKPTIIQNQQTQAIFSVFPYGIQFKTFESTSGGYMVYFKVDYDSYRYYCSKKTKQPIKNKEVDSIKVQSRQSIMIQICISCRLTSKQPNITSKQVALASKQVAQISKKQSLTSNRNKSLQTCQSQFFVCELFLYPSPAITYPYREINITSQQCFYQLNIANLIRQKEQVNIYSKQTRILNVLNGNKFKYLKIQNQILRLQILQNIPKLQLFRIDLIVDNWERGQTTIIQLGLINRNTIQAKKTNNQLKDQTNKQTNKTNNQQKNQSIKQTKNKKQSSKQQENDKLLKKSQKAAQKRQKISFSLK